MYYVASKVVLEYKEGSMISTDMPKMVTKEESNLVSTALIPAIPTITALSSLVERLLRAVEICDKARTHVLGFSLTLGCK